MKKADRFKRAIDVLLTVACLPIVAPLLLVTGLLVRLKLGSPVLFAQTRPGRYGVPFTMYKFRTMNDRRGEDGALLHDAERLTSFGSLLRRSSLDELPALFNVLKGEMSLVGPRPLLMEYLPLYSAEQNRRHEVRPGITGWAQVNGRNAISWQEKFELDVWYVDNHSFRLDMNILWKTVAKVISKEGVSAANHVTTERFRGNDE